jgi:PilZ domain
MKSQRPHARRYPFNTTIELTDVGSEEHTSEQASDLSLFGCHVDARKPLPTATRVRIRIVRERATSIALGKVAYTDENGGMGIAFTKIESNHQLVLEKWIAELRTREKPCEGSKAGEALRTLGERASSVRRPPQKSSREADSGVPQSHREPAEIELVAAEPGEAETTGSFNQQYGGGVTDPSESRRDSRL